MKLVKSLHNVDIYDKQGILIVNRDFSRPLYEDQKRYKFDYDHHYLARQRAIERGDTVSSKYHGYIVEAIYRNRQSVSVPQMQTIFNYCSEHFGKGK